MDYPPSNQDFNVIASVWAHLRDKFHAFASAGIEKLKDFINRLHGAMRSLHIFGQDMLADMCSGFQERCREVIQRKGGRIDY